MQAVRVIRALLVSAAFHSVLVTVAHADGPAPGPGGPGGPAGAKGPGPRGPDAGLGHKEPAPPPPHDGAGLPPLDQDEALAAVQSSAALPLDQIVTVARRLTQGQIVDAELSAATGPLLYRLTVLEPTGEVRAFYFYAGTGQLFRVE